MLVDELRLIGMLAEDEVGEGFAKIFFFFITLFHCIIVCPVLSYSFLNVFLFNQRLICLGTGLALVERYLRNFTTSPICPLLLFS